MRNVSNDLREQLQTQQALTILEHVLARRSRSTVAILTQAGDAELLLLREQLAAERERSQPSTQRVDTRRPVRLRKIFWLTSNCFSTCKEEKPSKTPRPTPSSGLGQVVYFARMCAVRSGAVGIFGSSDQSVMVWTCLPEAPEEETDAPAAEKLLQDEACERAPSKNSEPVAFFSTSGEAAEHGAGQAGCLAQVQRDRARTAFRNLQPAGFVRKFDRASSRYTRNGHIPGE